MKITAGIADRSSFASPRLAQLGDPRALMGRDARPVDGRLAVGQALEGIVALEPGELAARIWIFDGTQPA